MNPKSREGKYCSKKCRIEGTKRKIKICPECGKIFRTNRTFCCLQCSANAKKKTRLNKICETCNKPFIVKKGYTHARYCSLKCSSIAIGNRHCGKNNWNWKGGAIRWRGKNWIKQSNEARQRDNFTCQICKLFSTNPVLPVHHIIPYRQFKGDYLKANVLDNLITLCPSCHVKVECGAITLPNKLINIKPRNADGTFATIYKTLTEDLVIVL